MFDLRREIYDKLQHQEVAYLIVIQLDGS